MYRVIDLDQAGKDADSYVFLITLGTDKVGLNDQEVAEIIRAKQGIKTTNRKISGKGLKGSAATELDVNQDNGDAQSEGIPLA